MRKPRGRGRAQPQAAATFERFGRPLTLAAQVEQALRQAIAEDRFPDGKLPTGAELAEQMGVSRETVRLAAESLQREGLLVKFRHRGTFTRQPSFRGQIKSVGSKLLGYLQADFRTAHGQEEVANRALSGLLLQGALAEAGAAGFKLELHHAAHTRWGEAARGLCENARLRGVIFASYGEPKLLGHLVGRGLPMVLLDEDMTVPQVHSVRDDCGGGASQAVRFLAQLGHRRIAYAHWLRPDSNRWRLMGYRQGLRDAGLPHRRAWEILTDLTEVGARELTDKFLTLAPRPTALYCFNNTLARFAIEELRRRGVRVPEDVSVVGAGGEEVPGLTYHQVDWYQMGRTAVEILLRTLATPKRHKPEHHLFAHTLRVGQTTAGPGS